MPKAQEPPANGIAVDPAWQDRMNDETIAQLMALQGELDRRSREQMEALVASATKTLAELKVMIRIVFAIVSPQTAAAVPVPHLAEPSGDSRTGVRSLY